MGADVEAEIQMNQQLNAAKGTLAGSSAVFEPFLLFSSGVAVFFVFVCSVQPTWSAEYHQSTGELWVASPVQAKTQTIATGGVKE